MRVLVTGSAGHLGEALMRCLHGHNCYGLDLQPSPFTHHVGSITDRAFVHAAMAGMDAVLHTATLHKPHVATHSRQAFVDTNVTGTLNLLEEAAAAGVSAFVFSSSTSVFGDTLRPAEDVPAAWITEESRPSAKNIYGVTKLAAEDLCSLFHKTHGLNCVVLRVARFFSEDDDDAALRDLYQDDNLKANEFLHRRVDIEDVVSAHKLALQHAPALGFDRFIISATTPFTRHDVVDLRRDAPAVVAQQQPSFAAEFERRGWRVFPTIGRVYDNSKARATLGWSPLHSFESVIRSLRNDQPVLSPLAYTIGKKGYHDRTYVHGPYPVAD